MAAYYLSKQCFAYKRLKQQIGQQCMVYSRLRKDGEIESIPGMYETTKDGRTVPTESGAAPLLRGGVISTIACFEEFVHDLLEEALDNIIYERKYEHDDTATKSHAERHFGGMCHKCQNYIEHVHLFKKDLPAGAVKRANVASFVSEKYSQEFLSSNICLHVWSKQYKINLMKPNPKLTKNVIDMIKGHKLPSLKEKLTAVIDEIQQIESQEQSGLDGIFTKVRNDLSGVTTILKGACEELTSLSETNEPLKKLYAKEKPSHSATKDPQFIDELFKDGPINYYYLIDEKWVSHMKIDNGRIICLLLRLFYGFRCIMAHGNSEKTLKGKGVLNNFPVCPECDGFFGCKDECSKKIIEVHKLSKKYDMCIMLHGKDKVLKAARKFPGIKPIENLKDSEAIKLHKKYFSKYVLPDGPIKPTANYMAAEEDESANTEESLEENFTFFHLFRIHHWLEESQREAYVTYQMLIRINQFVLLLAHRMRFAMAKIMMEQHGLEDGIWGVSKNMEERKRKISSFEKKHQERVQELQKCMKK